MKGNALFPFISQDAGGGIITNAMLRPCQDLCRIILATSLMSASAMLCTLLASNYTERLYKIACNALPAFSQPARCLLADDDYGD